MRLDQNHLIQYPVSDLPCLIHLDCISSTHCIVAPMPFEGDLGDGWGSDSQCDERVESIFFVGGRRAEFPFE